VQHDVSAVSIAFNRRPCVRAVGLLILVVSLTCGPAAPAQPVREPKPHTDAPSEVAGGPLELVEVTLGQVGTDLLLRVRSAGAWNANQLSTSAGRALCVRLFFGTMAGERSRICIVPRDGETGLRYTRLDERANAITVRPVSAVVTRPDARTVEATFRPAEVNLNMGRYSWQAETRWRDSGPCIHEFACTDRFPNSGNVVAAIRPLVEPPCFGAAARNPRRRCNNPALGLAVVPEPADALIAPNARCTPIEKSSPYACVFGARAVWPGARSRSSATATRSTCGVRSRSSHNPSAGGACRSRARAAPFRLPRRICRAGAAPAAAAGTWPCANGSPTIRACGRCSLPSARPQE
jgi:hypothetical protein